MSLSREGTVNGQGRYRIAHILVDLQEGGEDEYRAMRSRINDMENELRGFYYLGNSETHGWPSVSATCNCETCRARTTEEAP